MKCRILAAQSFSALEKRINEVMSNRRISFVEWKVVDNELVVLLIFDEK